MKARLRPLYMEDAIPFYKVLDKNRARLSRFFPQTTKAVSSEKLAYAFVKKSIQQREWREKYVFGIFREGKIIGLIQALQFDWRIPKCEIGYFLDEDMEGRGIMTDCLAEVTKFCFEELRLTKVVLRISPDNVASIHVAEKNNYKFEGLHKSEFRIDTGDLVDVGYYSIIQPEKFVIKPSVQSDIDMVYDFFDSAVKYQKKKNYPVWKEYDTDILKADIAQKRQYKILKNGQIVCFFSICFDDPIVWRERNNEPAIYLHRVVVNPDYKAQKLFGKVLQWTKKYAQLKSIPVIRLDTWADNAPLVGYYMGFGFEFVEHFTTPDDPDLPMHQRGNKVVLLECKS